MLLVEVNVSLYIYINEIYVFNVFYTKSSCILERWLFLPAPFSAHKKAGIIPIEQSPDSTFPEKISISSSILSCIRYIIPKQNDNFIQIG